MHAGKQRVMLNWWLINALSNDICWFLSGSPACWSIGFGYVATTPPATQANWGVTQANWGVMVLEGWYNPDCQLLSIFGSERINGERINAWNKWAVSKPPMLDFIWRIHFYTQLILSMKLTSDRVAVSTCHHYMGVSKIGVGPPNHPC